MKKFIIFGAFIFLCSFSLAIETSQWDYNPLDVAGNNYTINVNYSDNSGQLQGYTPLTLYSYFTGLLSNIFYLKSNPFGFYNSSDFVISDYVPYTGGTSNLNLSEHNITATKYTTTKNESHGIYHNGTDMFIGYIGGL